MPKRLLKPFTFAANQVGQIYRGVRSLVSWTFARDIIPDWILKITVEAIPDAFWGDTPREQIRGSIILIGWSIATSLFTGGVTAVFVIFFSIFLAIGIVRFSSVGSGAWDSLTSFTTPSLPGRGDDGSYGRRRGR